jgi:hypothetical protein
MKTAFNNSEAIFTRLRDILQHHADKFSVNADRPDYYCLSIPWSPKFNKGFPIAWVKVSKSYVSYHLMPVYMLPQLKKTISAELIRRMQGKSCFNFKVIDEYLFKEIENLTAHGFEECKKVGILA